MGVAVTLALVWGEGLGEESGSLRKRGNGTESVQRIGGLRTETSGAIESSSCCTASVRVGGVKVLGQRGEARRLDAAEEGGRAGYYVWMWVS
jgi:hypothetical protein